MSWFKHFETFADCFKAPTPILLPHRQPVSVTGICIKVKPVRNIFIGNERLVLMISHYLAYSKKEGDKFGLFLDVKNMVPENICCTLNTSCNTSFCVKQLPDDQLQDIICYISNEMQDKKWPGALVDMTVVGLCRKLLSPGCQYLNRNIEVSCYELVCTCVQGRCISKKKNNTVICSFMMSETREYAKLTKETTQQQK